MKKSLLTLLVITTFALSACDDKALQEKISQAESKIQQLETELKTAKTALTEKQAEFDKLTSEAEQTKKAFPALHVKIETLFDKTETLKFEKDPQDEFAREESGVSVFATAANTGVAWLDKLLLEQMISSEDKPMEGTKENAQKYFNRQFTDFIATAKEEKPIGLSLSVVTQYLGQRNNIVSFSQFYDEYHGGAHGIYSSHFLNIDINKQAIISLDNLVKPEHKKKLKELLWQTYLMSNMDDSGKYVGFADPKEFEIADNFYFTETGVTFVYPVYVLGAFAEGEIVLEANWFEINQWLNPEYQRTEADGFFSEKQEF